jgi:hypothetical protein
MLLPLFKKQGWLRRHNGYENFFSQELIETHFFYEILNSLGKSVSLGQLYSAAGLFSVPLFLIAGGGSVVFWIIG